MNTNNVYFTKIFRIINIEPYFGKTLLDSGYSFSFGFSRDTLVYQKSDDQFYDLLAGKILKAEPTFCSKLGTEIVSVKHLIPFNTIVNQNKKNLSKCKIKKLYMEHKNNV